MPSSLHSLRKKLSGIWVSMPAPSSPCAPCCAGPRDPPRPSPASCARRSSLRNRARKHRARTWDHKVRLYGSTSSLLNIQGAERPFLHELPTEHKWVAIVLHTSIWKSFWNGQRGNTSLQIALELFEGVSELLLFFE